MQRGVGEFGTVAAGPFGIDDGLLADPARQVGAIAPASRIGSGEKLRIDVVEQRDTALGEKARVRIGAVEHGIEGGQVGIGVDRGPVGYARRKDER